MAHSLVRCRRGSAGPWPPLGSRLVGGVSGRVQSFAPPFQRGLGLLWRQLPRVVAPVVQGGAQGPGHRHSVVSAAGTQRISPPFKNAGQAGPGSGHQGPLDPEAALYGIWKDSCTSNRTGRPRSVGNALQLAGEGSASSHRSSTPALLHTLPTRHAAEEARSLNQVRAKCLGGVSELVAALHHLHLPDEEMEVGEITVFFVGSCEAPSPPRATNPVYDGRPSIRPYAVLCNSFRRKPAKHPTLLTASYMPHSWTHPHLLPPPLGEGERPS